MPKIKMIIYYKTNRMINKAITINGNLTILYIGKFDLYDCIEDRIHLKDIIRKLFPIDDEIFFFFNREEDLTKQSELDLLRVRIFEKFENDGKFEYLYKIDDRRFEAIGMIRVDLNTPNFILDCWKFFYSCSFFKPINDLTFEEYKDYIDVNGGEDINGLKHLWDKLTNFNCIKALGGDYLILSYESDLKLGERI